MLEYISLYLKIQYAALRVDVYLNNKLDCLGMLLKSTSCLISLKTTTILNPSNTILRKGCTKSEQIWYLTIQGEGVSMGIEKKQFVYYLKPIVYRITFPSESCTVVRCLVFLVLCYHLTFMYIAIIFSFISKS